MSIIVKGVKMPEDCPVCPLAHWNKLDRFTGCEVTKRYFSKEDMETKGRPSFCPLEEAPDAMLAYGNEPRRSLAEFLQDVTHDGVTITFRFDTFMNALRVECSTANRQEGKRRTVYSFDERSFTKTLDPDWIVKTVINRLRGELKE